VTGARPLVIAHRGASAQAYQNSLDAFRRAVALGADGIELDIHQTADDQLVVHHDPEFGGRKIANHALAELRKERLPNGEPIPTLAEALETIGAETQVFIEVKGLRPDGDDVFFATIDAGPAPANYRVHGFDHRIVCRLCTARPTLPGGVLSSSYPLDPSAEVRAAHAVAFWEEAILVDVPLAAALHADGFALYAWTVNDSGEMRELIAAGVDGLCTNKPDVARGVVG